MGDDDAVGAHRRRAGVRVPSCPPGSGCSPTAPRSASARCSSHLVAPHLVGALPRIPAIVVSMVAAIAISLLVSRLTMRLMPLVVLLRMTMLFPDRAPSRLKVARRATSMKEITALLASPDLTESEAASTMLSLVTALGRHDRKTRGHSERVRLFCDLLSRELDLPGGRRRTVALGGADPRHRQARGRGGGAQQAGRAEPQGVAGHQDAPGGRAPSWPRHWPTGSGPGSTGSPSTTSASTARATRAACTAPASRSPVGPSRWSTRSRR